MSDEKMIMISQKDWDNQQSNLKKNNDKLLKFYNQPTFRAFMPQKYLGELKALITNYIELEEVVKDTEAA